MSTIPMHVPVTNALAGALGMIDAGYAVQPCHVTIRAHDGKKIITKGSLPDGWESFGATRDQVLTRFKAGANAYLVCCGPSGIVVPDLDIKAGEDGIASWGNRPTGGITVRTLSGGLHHYFTNDTQTGCPTSGLPGVDIKGIGGGVFGPGSFEGAYEVLAWGPLAPFSTVGLDLKPTRKRPRVATSRPDDIYIEETAEQADAAIRAACIRVREQAKTGWGSEFHTVLRDAAYVLGRYVGGGHITAEDAERWLHEAIEAAQQTPDEDDEAKIHSGLVKGSLAPTWVLPRVIRPLAGPPAADESESTGRRRNLRPYFEGTRTVLMPSVGACRSDGVQMLYPRRWHTVIGLTEAGKSMFATWQAVEILRNGGTVAYLHFEETSEDGTLERLCAIGATLGLDQETIIKQFVWLSCESTWYDGELTAELEALPIAPELVVLDGINDACGLLGCDVEKPIAVTKYKRMFVAPATAAGAAVLSLGHPVKDRNRQDERHSFGSTAWLDAVDGVSFRLESSANPITKGRLGSSALSVVKDRYGEVKRHGLPNSKREAGWHYFGQFTVDGSTDQLAVTLSLPAATETPEGIKGSSRTQNSEIDDKVYRTVKQLLAKGAIPNTRMVIALAGIKATRATEALTRLSLPGGRLLKLDAPSGRGFAYQTNPDYSEELGELSPFVGGDHAS